jgi:hypothetical protein
MAHRRNNRPVRNDEPNAHVSYFRSDNDLRAFRLSWPLSVTLCGMSFGLLELWHAPLICLPLALVPGVVAFVALHLKRQRDARRGRRFNQYDTSDPDL